MKRDLPVDVSDLGLTPRELKFCLEYISNGYNAEEAAKSAGLISRDAGSAVCRVFCAKLLKEDKIKTAIRRTQESFIEPYRDVHFPKMLEILEIRATYDIKDYYDSNNDPIPFDKIPVKKRHAIDNIDRKKVVDRQGNVVETIVYILADKDKARAELRAMYEPKGEKKEKENTSIREEILGMLEAFGAGAKAGMRLEVNKASPAAPISASDLAKKIKEGEYVIEGK